MSKTYLVKEDEVWVKHSDIVGGLVAHFSQKRHDGLIIVQLIHVVHLDHEPGCGDAGKVVIELHVQREHIVWTRQIQLKQVTITY